MENTSKIKLFEGVKGGLENPHNSCKISALALSVLRNMARTHRESVKPSAIVATTEPTEPDDCPPEHEDPDDYGVDRPYLGGIPRGAAPLVIR